MNDSYSILIIEDEKNRGCKKTPLTEKSPRP